jgi:hypothetical protein
MIARLHGNYDPDKPIYAKNFTLGRLLTQFRTWALEGFANRFEGEKFDSALGMARKGRYRSMYDVARQKGLFKALYALVSKAERDGLSDVDAANMRRNFAELMIYTAMTSLLMLMRGLAEDDEDKAMALNVMINLLTRINQDIAFYVSPTSFEQITRQSIPAMKLVTDTGAVLDASWRLILGDDEIKGGIYSGESRFAKEVTEMLPFTSQLRRIDSARKQVFDD